MCTTQEENVIFMFQAAIHHFSRGVWWTRELDCTKLDWTKCQLE